MGGRIAFDDAVMEMGEEAFGQLADDDEIERLAARIGERPGDAGNRAHRPDAGIEAELHANVDLRRDLGTVGMADRRVAHRGEQDRVRAPRLRHRRRRQRLAEVAIGRRHRRGAG